MNGWTVEMESDVDTDAADALLESLFEKCSEIYESPYYIATAEVVGPPITGYFVVVFFVASRKIAMRRYDKKDEAEEVAERMHKRLRAKYTN